MILAARTCKCGVCPLWGYGTRCRARVVRCPNRATHMEFVLYHTFQVSQAAKAAFHLCVKIRRLTAKTPVRRRSPSEVTLLLSAANARERMRQSAVRSARPVQPALTPTPGISSGGSPARLSAGRGASRTDFSTFRRPSCLRLSRADDPQLMTSGEKRGKPALVGDTGHCSRQIGRYLAFESRREGE